MLNYLDVVKAISTAKNRSHVLVSYLNVELKTDDLRHYNAHSYEYECMSNARLYLRLLMII